jgi:hypothetical protein
MANFQIPRNSLAWMLAAQGAVIAPHLPRLTPWVIGCCVACGVWRVMVFRGRWAYPGRWTKAALVIGGLIAVPVSYSKLYGLEPAVALLIVAFTLKLLEMQKQRDAFIVIVMAYFVGVTEFLFDQGIPMTLYIMVVMVMITAALVGLNQTVSHGNPLSHGKDCRHPAATGPPDDARALCPLSPYRAAVDRAAPNADRSHGSQRLDDAWRHRAPDAIGRTCLPRDF